MMCTPLYKIPLNLNYGDEKENPCCHPPTKVCVMGFWPMSFSPEPKTFMSRALAYWISPWCALMSLSCNEESNESLWMSILVQCPQWETKHLQRNLILTQTNKFPGYILLDTNCRERAYQFTICKTQSSINFSLMPQKEWA